MKNALITCCTWRKQPMQLLLLSRWCVFGRQGGSGGGNLHVFRNSTRNSLSAHVTHTCSCIENTPCFYLQSDNLNRAVIFWAISCDLWGISFANVRPLRKKILSETDWTTGRRSRRLLKAAKSRASSAFYQSGNRHWADWPLRFLLRQSVSILHVRLYSLVAWVRLCFWLCSSLSVLLFLRGLFFFFWWVKGRIWSLRMTQPSFGNQPLQVDLIET